MDQETTAIVQSPQMHIERPIPLGTLEEIVKFAEITYKAGIFPDIKNAQQAVVKIMLGRELGFGPLASMRGIMFDRRGAITLSSNIQAAAVQRAGFTWKLHKLDESACEMEFFDTHGKSIGVSSLTMQQARAAKMDQQWDDEKAGWKPKATWQSYPRNMLFARCMSNGVKWFLPAVTNGVTVYDPDELTPIDPAGEIIDVTPHTTEPVKTEPKAEPVKAKNGNAPVSQVDITEQTQSDDDTEAEGDAVTLAEMMASAQAMLDNPPKSLTKEQKSIVFANWDTVTKLGLEHGIMSAPPADRSRFSEYLDDIVKIGAAVQAAISEDAAAMPKKAVA